ncbi:carbonic anhydrase [Mycobacterium canetti]|uniref:carbonic anhydrase n=1 Tax=Mycobacterium canetti TaxID=78331 RepID=UPI0027E2D553|nr:carbonic anhydrase [Mycobacterium canetti]
MFRNHHPARRSAESAGYPEADQLSIVNVAVQVERLTRHPILATAVAAADLQVIGIFFDISTARVYEWVRTASSARRASRRPRISAVAPATSLPAESDWCPHRSG